MSVLTELVFAHDLQVGIVASILASAATYLVLAIFRIRLPSIAHMVFWRAFNKDVVIVMSEIHGEYDGVIKRGVQPPLTPIGDALVLGEFLLSFRRRLKSDPAVVSVQSLDALDRVKDNNLLIIGGPKNNFAAEAYLSELDHILPYQFRRLRPRETHSGVSDDQYLKRFVGPNQQEMVADPERDVDFGFVIVTRSPYNSRRKLVVIAGLSTLSTLAASQWLLGGRRPFLWLRFRAGAGFQAVIQCRDTGPTSVSDVKGKAVFLLSRRTWRAHDSGHPDASVSDQESSGSTVSM